MRPEDVLKDKDKTVQQIYENMLSGKVNEKINLEKAKNTIIKKELEKTMKEWEKIATYSNAMFEFLFVKNKNDKSPEMKNLTKLWKNFNDSWNKVNGAAEKYKNKL